MNTDLTKANIYRNQAPCRLVIDESQAKGVRVEGGESADLDEDFGGEVSYACHGPVQKQGSVSRSCLDLLREITNVLKRLLHCAGCADCLPCDMPRACLSERRHVMLMPQ